MKYYTIQPPPSISKFVRHFWILEGEASSANPYVHRSMADGSAELIFHYNGIFKEFKENNDVMVSFSSGLDAQSHKIRRYGISSHFGIFGVYMYPFALPVLFSIPASEVTSLSIDLKTLLGKNDNGLEEKMILAKSNLQRAEIITQFLEQKVRNITIVKPEMLNTISSIVNSNGLINSDQLSQNHFLSRRQFERNFKEFSGFSPKVYCRIIRFQNALKYYGNRSKSLTQIGLEVGYSDQSHFIRDFKEFSGYTPKEYFLFNGEGTDWKDTE